MRGRSVPSRSEGRNQVIVCAHHLRRHATSEALDVETHLFVKARMTQPPSRQNSAYLGLAGAERIRNLSLSDPPGSAEISGAQGSRLEVGRYHSLRIL